MSGCILSLMLAGTVVFELIKRVKLKLVSLNKKVLIVLHIFYEG